MARRHWFLALGTGASVCLLAGCLHTASEPSSRPFMPPPLIDPSRNGSADVVLPKSFPLKTGAVEVVRSELRSEPEIEPQVVIESVDPTSVEIKPAPEAPKRLPEPVVTQPAKPTPAPTPAATQPAPPPPEPAVVRALRCLVEKHPDEAVGLLRGYDKSQQEMLLALLPLAACGDAGFDRARPEEAAALLDRINAVAQALRARAPLVLDHMCFCHTIRNFGDYDPLSDKHRFQAGTDGHPGERVQVYVEVRNFTSRRHGAYFDTTLTSTLEIIDFSHKQVVWSKSFEPCVDRSRTQRQDYFVNFQFPVPARIPRGDYILRIRVWDGQRPKDGHADARTAECSLDFRVQGNSPDYRTGDIAPPLRSDPAE